jgi:DICT domain-containing protein
MSNQILHAFHHRMMPLFTPQAEKFIHTVKPETLNRIAFRYTFSVEAMIKISHIIEDAVLSNARVADLHVSFQYLSRIRPQEPRYRRLAESAHGLWLYGAPDPGSPNFDGWRNLTVINTAHTLLLDYWFVVAYGPGIGMSLLAEEVPALDSNDRYYEGFYTFEPAVAHQIISILHQIYPAAVPLPPAPEQLPQR